MIHFGSNKIHLSMHSVCLSGGDQMYIRAIPSIMSLTRLVEAQRHQLFTFTIYLYGQVAKPYTYTERQIHPLCRSMDHRIQKECSPMHTEENYGRMYTERSIRHVYRENDPTSIQRDITPPLYTEKVDPSSIQKEPSWALNVVTID